MTKKLRLLALLLGTLFLLLAACQSSPTGAPASTPTLAGSGEESGNQPPAASATPTAGVVAVSEGNSPSPTAGPSPTPTPSPTPSEPITIYQDSLAEGWNEWVWDVSTDYANPDPVYQGAASIAITPARAWAGWGIWLDEGIDTTPYTYLSLSIRATRPDEWFLVYLQDVSGDVLFPDGYPLNPPVDGWQAVQIPLIDLKASYTRIHGIRIMNTEDSQATYYLDEIGFGGTAPAPTPTPIPVPQQVALSVDAGVAVNAFSNQMLGVAMANWEHSWGKYFPADVPHLAEVFKAADVGLVRYAGGLWANWVGWERLPQRDPYTEWHPDPANYDPQFGGQVKTGNTYTFHYGLNEIDNLALFAQQSGAEVMIQVNVSQNDPAMWADLLHYTNVEHDYGFRYWELGNELDLETSQGADSGMSAAEYRDRVKAYARALRAVDPSIVIVGGVPASGHDILGANWAEGTDEMSRYLEAAVEGGADSLSYHWYQACNSYTDTGAVTVYEWPLQRGDDGIKDPYRNWRHTFSRIWSQISPQRVQNEIIPSGSAMTLGITELNLDSCDFDAAPQNSNHLNAVWMADVLGRLAYNGLDYLTWYLGYGTGSQGFPMIFSTEDFYPQTVYLRPPYYTLFLYANYFGDQLVASTSSNEAEVSIWASTDSQDPGTLKLVVTNISANPADAGIQIAGFTPLSGQRYTLSNPNPLDMSGQSNGLDHGSTLNGVTLEADNIGSALQQIEGIPVNIQGGQVLETFPPYSVTAIVLRAGE